MMASGYPDVIVHGWLTMAHMCRVATAAFPAGWTTSSYTVRYLGALHPGLLRCGGAVSDNNGWAAGLALWARDQTGRDVASASLLLSRATNEPGMDWHPLPPGADA
jgi:acyl dehydratase